MTKQFTKEEVAQHNKDGDLVRFNRTCPHLKPRPAKLNDTYVVGHRKF